MYFLFYSIIYHDFTFWPKHRFLNLNSNIDLPDNELHHKFSDLNWLIFFKDYSLHHTFCVDTDIENVL